MSESALDYRGATTTAAVSVFVQLLLIVLLIAASLSIGSLRIPTSQIPRLLVDSGADLRMHTVLVNIRLPQVSAALLCGAALSAAGAVMQIILHNPLGSPFTLGISNAAAFGASLSLLLFFFGISSELDNAVRISLLTGGSRRHTAYLLSSGRLPRGDDPRRCSTLFAVQCRNDAAAVCCR